MNIVLAIAQGVVVMAVAPFFSGLARVIRAKMHNRRGPVHLAGLSRPGEAHGAPESVSSDASFALRIMPPLFLAVAFMLAMGLPMLRAQSPIPVFGDAITIMYALALSRFFFALSGVDSSNAYAGIGGIRELLMSVLIEPSMLLALFTAAIVCGSTDIATMGQHIMTGAIDASSPSSSPASPSRLPATWNSASFRSIRPRPSKSSRKVRSPSFPARRLRWPSSPCP